MCKQCGETILIVIVWEEWISEMKKIINDGSEIQLSGDENNLKLVVTVRHEVYSI